MWWVRFLINVIVILLLFIFVHFLILLMAFVALKSTEKGYIKNNFHKLGNKWFDFTV